MVCRGNVGICGVWLQKNRKATGSFGAGGAVRQGEGVGAIVKGLSGKQSGAFVLLQAVGRGTGNWEWADRGSLQASDWEEVEADLVRVEGR